MKKILVIILLIVITTSCDQKPGNQMNYLDAGLEEQTIPITRQQLNAPPPPVPPIERIEKTDTNKKKIIKDGRLGLQVTELEKTKMWIDTLVRKLGGYYANESYNNTDYEVFYNLKIRIPASGFEKFIAEIEKGEGAIQYKEIDARDVTDQFIDLETRLENKRNYLKRYNELLKQAKNVKEILEIEEKIRGLEEEIESTTGRLSYLNDLVDYSTLDLMLSRKKDFRYDPGNRDKFSERLKQSLSKGWFGFVDFSLVMIKIWPFWILVALFIYIWSKFKKRKNEKKS